MKRFSDVLLVVLTLAWVLASAAGSLSRPYYGIHMELEGAESGVVRAHAGSALRPGDRVLRINGRSIRDITDVIQSIPGSGSPILRLDVERAGRRLQVLERPASRPFAVLLGQGTGTLLSLLFLGVRPPPRLPRPARRPRPRLRGLLPPERPRTDGLPRIHPGRRRLLPVGGVRLRGFVPASAGSSREGEASLARVGGRDLDVARADAVLSRKRAERVGAERRSLDQRRAVLPAAVLRLRHPVAPAHGHRDRAEPRPGLQRDHARPARDLRRRGERARRPVARAHGTLFLRAGDGRRGGDGDPDRAREAAGAAVRGPALLRLQGAAAEGTRGSR
ncbi:MAG: hypothetical protein H0V09_06710 [Gemmatimonadetes bacterium]|nr:hypothetical protein [Gemmatimonadota bacterium]